MLIISRRHRHSIRTCSLESQEIASLGDWERDILIKDIGRLAGSTNDCILGTLFAIGCDVLDIVIRAIERRADKLRHTCIYNHKATTCCGSLIEEHLGNKLATLRNDRTAKLEVHLALAYIEVLLDDCEYRSEVRNWLIFRHIVVYAKTTSNIYKLQLEAEISEILNDNIHLVAHILEHMQLANLRTDMDVHTDNIDMLQRLDILNTRKNLLVRDTELTIGLTCIDTVVSLWIDIRVYTQGNRHNLAHLACDIVHNIQLLDRLAVDCEDALLDSVANLLIPLTYACVDDSLRIETRLDSALNLVTARAVDTQAVLANNLQEARIVVCLDGVVYLVVVTTSHRHQTIESLMKEVDVVEVEWGFVVCQLGGNLSAQHNLLPIYYIT